MFDTALVDGVLQLSRPETCWLSTGWNGGFERADAAYNITVPEGWERTGIEAYIRTRREGAGFSTPGPALLTGVEMHHARGARLDPVVAYATVGLSNPAVLPMDPKEADDAHDCTETDSPDASDIGTVNLIVGTTRALEEAAHANLLSLVAETKAATLLAEADIPGTTTDAIVVGTDRSGTAARFTGSATPVGRAARACVREAIRASFRSRYADREPPSSFDEAEHGTVAREQAEVFIP